MNCWVAAGKTLRPRTPRAPPPPFLPPMQLARVRLRGTPAVLRCNSGTLSFPSQPPIETSLHARSPSDLPCTRKRWGGYKSFSFFSLSIPRRRACVGGWVDHSCARPTLCAAAADGQTTLGVCKALPHTRSSSSIHTLSTHPTNMSTHPCRSCISGPCMAGALPALPSTACIAGKSYPAGNLGCHSRQQRLQYQTGAEVGLFS
jgi:hypothetical protein